MKRNFKKIALLLLGVICLSLICGCTNKADIENESSITVSENTQEERQWVLKTIFRNNSAWREDYTYNKYGNLIHVDGMSEQGEYTADYSYDEQQNLILIESISTDYRTKDIYKYDGRGNLIEHKTETTSLSYLYTDSENTITYTYDSQDRILLKKYNKGREVYSYNNDGSYKIETYTSTDVWVNTVYCDNENRVVGSEGREGTGEIKRTFDESGKIISEATYLNGTLGEITEFEYDENRNLISKTTIAPDGTKSNLQYEYDENRNCIRTRKFEADGTSKIVEECEYIFITVSK